MPELEMTKKFIAPPVKYPQTALDCKVNYENMVRAQQNNTLTILQRKETCLKIQIAVITPTEVDKLDKLEEQLSEVESKILRAQYDINASMELPLTKEEKGEWQQNQKAYGEQINKHLLNQQKAFAIIIGQCT